MWKSLKSFLVENTLSFFKFLGSLLSGLVDLLWGVLKPAFELLFSLLGTIFGRLLATLTLIIGIALSPLVAIIKETVKSFATMLGASPDVVASLFPNNFQALCYVAVNYCSLDVMISCIVTFMGIKGACYAVKVAVWGARKAASVTRGAGV